MNARNLSLTRKPKLNGAPVFNRLNFGFWVIAIPLLLGAAPIQAQSDLFGPNDLSLDAFGYTASRDKSGADDRAWGLGVALNYFFSQHWGLSAETYADAFKLPYLLNAHALFRYPLAGQFAPYAFAGFGRQWDHAPQWLGHLGGGLEFRFNEPTAVFADIRRVFAEETKDYTLVRFGIRFRF